MSKQTLNPAQRSLKNAQYLSSLSTVVFCFIAIFCGMGELLHGEMKIRATIFFASLSVGVFVLSYVFSHTIKFVADPEPGKKKEDYKFSWTEISSDLFIVVLFAVVMSYGLSDLVTR